MKVPIFEGFPHGVKSVAYPLGDVDREYADQFRRRFNEVNEMLPEQTFIDSHGNGEGVFLSLVVTKIEIKYEPVPTGDS
jgi:hypothetical protein